MAQYAYVKDNKIVELHDSIPQNWKNISGFNLLSDEDRAALGFVVVEQQPAEDYDPAIHDISADNFIDSTGKVIYKETIAAKYSEEELVALKRNAVLALVREHRSALLSSTDWAVMPDVVAVKGEQWKNAYYVYRQALRDITNELPLEFDDVVWPVLEVV